MIEEMGKNARAASHVLAKATTNQKNAVLISIGRLLLSSQADVLEANRLDVEPGRQAGLSEAILDRLTLTGPRLEGIRSDLEQVAALPDPVNEIFDQNVLPNGLRLRKQRVPIGVLGVIYESRPNVTIDIAGLALKTGNAVILRGGSESIHSNRSLVEVIRQALKQEHLPGDAIQFIDDPDRRLVGELLKMNDYVDMIIPRGGATLHNFCRENSRIPVITGGIGICHLFVDESANLQASLPVIRNAKIQRPSVCNALDTVLVHQAVAQQFIPVLVEHLAADGVTFRVDERALRTLANQAEGVVFPAGGQDFDTEWLSLVLGIKVVDNLTAAIEHISKHSTAHSDGILTNNLDNARRFVAEVDSAAVYVNASTRFTDGGQFGLGAEVAISTQRLHARGPMGLRELTSYKWVIEGDYHFRP